MSDERMVSTTRRAAGRAYEHWQKMASFHKAFMEATTADDIAQVTRTLIDTAKAGKSWAIKEFLDRALGKPLVNIQMDGNLAVDARVEESYDFSALSIDERIALAEMVEKIRKRGDGSESGGGSSTGPSTVAG